jgi:transposase-like protein
MSIFSKEQDNYLDYISKQIVHQILNKNDQNQIIESLFKQTAEVLLEVTDFSKYEPNIRLMYKRAVSDSNKYLNQLILSKVGNSEGANDTARIYTVVKNYIVKKIFDLVATTIDFKNILKETKFSKFLKNKILFEALTPSAPVTPAPVTPAPVTPAPAPASDMKVDMSKFRPNISANWVKYLGPTKRQEGNFKTIVDTILDYINSQYTASLPSTANNKEFYLKVKKIHKLVKEKISDFLDKEISPKIMPQIDTLTKSKVKEYDDSNASKAEYDKDKQQNNIMLLNKILKFVRLPDANSIINQMKDEKTIESIHDQIIRKITKAKLSENNIKFILETTKTVLSDNIKTMKKDAESSGKKQIMMGVAAISISFISVCLVMGAIISVNNSVKVDYSSFLSFHKDYITTVNGIALTLLASIIRTFSAGPFLYFKDKRLNKIFELMKKGYKKIQDKINEPKPDEDSFQQDCPYCDETYTFKQSQIGHHYKCTNSECERRFKIETPTEELAPPVRNIRTRIMEPEELAPLEPLDTDEPKPDGRMEEPIEPEDLEPLKIKCPRCEVELTITHKIFDNRLNHICPHCKFKFNPYFWFYDMEEEEEEKKRKKKGYLSSLLGGFRSWFEKKNKAANNDYVDYNDDDDGFDWNINDTIDD